MRKFTLLISILAILLASCTKKIDGSSEETLKSSIEEIKASLDAEKKEKFEEALTLFMFHGIDFANLLEDGGEKTITDLKSSLDGKSANDIIAEGEKIKIEIERRKKEQAKIEIDEPIKIENNKISITSYSETNTFDIENLLNEFEKLE